MEGRKKDQADDNNRGTEVREDKNEKRRVGTMIHIKIAMNVFSYNMLLIHDDHVCRDTSNKTPFLSLVRAFLFFCFCFFFFFNFSFFSFSSFFNFSSPSSFCLQLYSLSL